jgi:hypothetical protein
MARKCKVKMVNSLETKKFLNENHIQGWCVSKINIGLYENDELVSLMTFGKMRINLGIKSTKDGEYELLRFCNKLNYSVIGGPSKLFKYFIEVYNPHKIISFSENDLFSGKLYEKLGMYKINESINYYWSDGIHRYNRWKFRKSELIKKGFDENKTSNDIMIEKGFYKCWNSGNKKYELLL